jgi:hypothetical protein
VTVIEGILGLIAAAGIAALYAVIAYQNRIDEMDEDR